MEKRNKQKFAGFLIYDDEQFSAILKEVEEGGVERGLLLTAETNIGRQMVKMFEEVASRGYYVNGFIVDGESVEFLFQRHKGQTKDMRYEEVKYEGDRKYKI